MPCGSVGQGREAADASFTGMWEKGLCRCAETHGLQQAP